MKNLVVVLLLVAVNGIAFCQKTFEITGSVLNAAAGKSIYYSYYNEKEEYFELSAPIENNHFAISGEISEPVMVTFYNNQYYDGGSPASYYPFYVEPKSINLNFDYTNLSTIQVSGVKTQDEYLKLNKIIEPIDGKIMDNRRAVNELYKKLPPLNASEKKELQLEIDKYEAIDDALKTDKAKAQLKFATENPGSYLAPTLLISVMKGFAGDQFYPQVKTAFTAMTPELKNTSKGILLTKTFSNFEKSKVGSTAPAFSVKDSYGKILNIESFRNNNYVLLDFWASWCAPCVDEFPFMKELYEKYKGNGLEIINISQDEDPIKWKAGIARHGIGIWIQVLLANNIGNTLAADYFVGVIPQKILIDKNGIIVGRWRGGGTANTESLAIALKGIFK